MYYSQEIENLRKQILEKDIILPSGNSKTHLIELHIDVNRSTFSVKDYYNYILGPLKGLLLLDNFHLHITKFELFQTFWDMARYDVTLYYNCWITKITEDEKKELMGKQSLVDFSIESHYESDVVESKESNNCTTCCIL